MERTFCAHFSIFPPCCMSVSCHLRFCKKQTLWCRRIKIISFSCTNHRHHHYHHHAPFLVRRDLGAVTSCHAWAILWCWGCCDVLLAFPSLSYQPSNCTSVLYYEFILKNGLFVCNIYIYIYIYIYICIYVVVSLYIVILGFAYVVTFPLLRFSSDCHCCISVQTNPRSHPLSSTMDIGFFPGGTEGGKTVGVWPWHPTPSIAEVRNGTAITLHWANNDMLLGELYLCFY